MGLDPKDSRLSDPKFQEFEDLVVHVMDKREAKRKAEDEAAALEKENKKPRFPFSPF